MGARINMENDIDAIRKELEELKSENEQLKTAFSGLASTVETLEMSSTVRKNNSDFAFCMPICTHLGTVPKSRIKRILSLSFNSSGN